MKISSKDFRVREGDEVDLRKWPTTVEPVYESKKHYHKLLGEHIVQLSSLQQLLYASNRYAVLLIFQAMDAAGKDVDRYASVSARSDRLSHVYTSRRTCLF